MRPHTPSLSVANTAAGLSPPETPTTASPSSQRKAAPNGRPSAYANPSRRMGPDSNIRPIGGTHFSYRRGPRPEEISPRSMHSSEDDDDNDDDDDEEDDDDDADEDDDAEEDDDRDDDEDDDDDSEDSDSSDSLPQSPLSRMTEVRKRAGIPPPAAIRIEHAELIIEELSDFSRDGDGERIGVLRPYGFEYPESDRSRSRSRAPPELDPAIVRDFQNLNAFHDDDLDEEFGDADEFERQLQADRHRRRIRRMNSGSISKRTVSERGSDSDKEDVLPYYEGTEPGNLRRTRRKVGDRTSIQLTGQLPPRIEELKEPNSEDEIILDEAEIFAKELPYFEFMDVDTD